jgi:hypothetical protein
VRTETILNTYVKVLVGLKADRSTPRRWYQRQTFERELFRRARDYDRRRGVKLRDDHLHDARERMRWIFRSWWTQAPEAAEAAISWEAAGFPWRACIMRGYAELWGRK